MTSVIVSTLNSQSSVAGTLRSIREQSRPPGEILVIDGGSRDGTLEVATPFLRPHDRIVSEPDRGPYDAMNKGIKLAQGEIVAILNSDDRWLPDTLAKVEAAFQKSPDVGIVHGDIQYVVDDAKTLRIKPTTGFWRSFGLGLPTVHPATFVRKDVYREHGFYNFERFRITADQEMMYRLFAAGVRDVYLGEILTVMSAGGLSTRVNLTDEFDGLLDVLQPRKRALAKIIRRVLGRNNGFCDGSISTGFGRHILVHLLRPSRIKKMLGTVVKRKSTPEITLGAEKPRVDHLW